MPLDRFFNEDEVNGKQPIFERYFHLKMCSNEKGTYPVLSDEDITGIPSFTTPNLEVHYYTPQGGTWVVEVYHLIQSVTLVIKLFS